MVDPFGRHVHYMRLSVTDRCDLRCVYCMAESMTFLPKADLLTLEELARLSRAFMGLGVRKLRLTGGEPLVRRGIMDLIADLGRDVVAGRLEELTLTTNATLLDRHAEGLARAGVRRVNVSLDSRDPARFQRITRWGAIDRVMGGIAAAKAAGLQVKINMVALRGENEHEIEDMIRWCGENRFDLTLIETMPLGDIDEDRVDQYLSLTTLRRHLETRFTLTDLPDRTGGPARYVRIEETGARLGFITPLSHNFCESCNRVRVTCTGQLYMCLGQDDQVDLRAPLRASPKDDAPLIAAIRRGIDAKPKGHDFVIERRGAAPALTRHMSMTGG
ncbi:GTP 3',8-cyclase MoaA [Tistrella bauzanensis]